MPTAAAPGWVIAAMLLYIAATSAWVFSPCFPVQWLQALDSASGGWLASTLVLAVGFGIVELWLLFGPGRQRPGDLGWQVGALPAAIAATLALWIAMNAATVFASHLEGTPLAGHPGWVEPGRLAGDLIAQVFGTALLEETVFRAWLWPQLALAMARRWSTRRAWGMALLASQAAFALLHVPALLTAGMTLPGLAGTVLMLFLTGIVLALLYAAARNLFFVVGVHALGNAPTLLFAPQGPAPTLVLLGAAVLVALAWWGWRSAREARSAS